MWAARSAVVLEVIVAGEEGIHWINSVNTEVIVLKVMASAEDATEGFFLYF